MSLTELPRQTPKQARPRTPYADLKERDFFNGHELAEYLGWSESYIRQLRAKGKGPRFIRLHRQVRYRRCDVEAWIATHLVQTQGY